MKGTMLDKAKLKDVPEKYREMAEILGMEAFKKLVINYGGCEIYIPVKETLTRSVRNSILKKTFNGDYTRSAKTYRLSENQVRRIIAGK